MSASPVHLPESDWREKLENSQAACRTILEEPAFQKITWDMQGRLAAPAACFAALSHVTYFPESVSPLLAHAAAIEAEPNQFGRWILLQSALAAAPKVSDLPLYGEVKALWAHEALGLAEPPPAWLSIFSMDHARFREMARIITLQRLPAGQFHWELSGFPRSYVPRTSWQQWPRLLTFLSANLGGFAPLVEIHVNARRKNRLSMTETEGLLSYFRIAKSLEAQPEVKGLFSTGWLFCESTGKITPRLAWLREFFLHNGAFVASAGFVAEDVGFKTGSEERRKLYEEGNYRPTNTYVLWPRREMLAWAARYQSAPNPN